LPAIALAAFLAAATGFGIQTWRIGQLQQEKGRLVAEVQECARANESNQRTIDALERANQRNATRYAEAQKRAEQAANRIGQLETQIKASADDDIEAIENVDTDCATRPLPDVIRLRVTRGSDEDADG
jgi:uncharacterized protein HemX